MTRRFMRTFLLHSSFRHCAQEAALRICMQGTRRGSQREHGAPIGRKLCVMAA